MLADPAARQVAEMQFSSKSNVQKPKEGIGVRSRLPYGVPSNYVAKRGGQVVALIRVALRVNLNVRPARLVNNTETKKGHMNIGYELLGTPDKGEGVFATKSFQCDGVVMVGVIKERVDENHSHASQIGEFEYVVHDGLISKVNHSCDPNCGVRVNPSGAHDFTARRAIKTGEEITFDYAMRNYTIDFFPSICACGSLKCRGAITGWKDMPPRRKHDYAGFVAPYLLELDARKSVLSTSENSLAATQNMKISEVT